MLYPDEKNIVISITAKGYSQAMDREGNLQIKCPRDGWRMRSENSFPERVQQEPHEASQSSKIRKLPPKNCLHRKEAHRSVVSQLLEPHQTAPSGPVPRGSVAEALTRYSGRSRSNPEPVRLVASASSRDPEPPVQVPSSPDPEPPHAVAMDCDDVSDNPERIPWDKYENWLSNPMLLAARSKQISPPIKVLLKEKWNTRRDIVILQHPLR